jgi:hypothetical protein
MPRTIRRRGGIRRAAVLIVLSAASSLAAQQATPPRPAPARASFDDTGVGDTSIFAPLPMRAATSYRAASGAPGHAYWQNRADYDLHATLDTGAKILHGSMALR